MPTRGRPRDEHSLRLLKGPHVKRSTLEQAEDASVQSPSTPPEPPEWLHQYAQVEWRRVAGDLHQNGWLGTVDESLLARYCQAYARWREAEEDITERHPIIKTKDDDRGQEWSQVNPSVKVAQRWGAEMQRCAASFGITPASRRGWTVPKANKTPHQNLLESLE